MLGTHRRRDRWYRRSNHRTCVPTTFPAATWRSNCLLSRETNLWFINVCGLQTHDWTEATRIGMWAHKYEHIWNYGQYIVSHSTHIWWVNKKAKLKHKSRKNNLFSKISSRTSYRELNRHVWLSWFVYEAWMGNGNLMPICSVRTQLSGRIVSAYYAVTEHQRDTVTISQRRTLWWFSWLCDCVVVIIAIVYYRNSYCCTFTAMALWFLAPSLCSVHWCLAPGLVLQVLLLFKEVVHYKREQNVPKISCI